MDKDGAGVRFLETPATVWGAESVLIDEISRAKPEHQNRLFSLVCERRIQGILLAKLRYRWAAMNPVSADQGGIEDYAGSEALDPALADRFSLIIKASDWAELTPGERILIADPAGEGKIADDKGELRREVEGWREEFLRRLENCPPEILRYVTTAVSALNSAGIRISPRRSRFMTRSLFAASIVAGKLTEKLGKLVLKSSLPQVCWGVTPPSGAVAAAHRLAWNTVQESPRNWLPSLMSEKSLAGKLRILLEQCDSPDAGTQAVAELLAAGPPERAAAFAFAVYPAVLEGKIPVGAEGMNDLARYASSFLSVDGTISWDEQLQDEGMKHPDLVRYAQALGGLEGGRAERARQFFNGCLVRRLRIDDPEALESEIQKCVELLKEKELI